MSGFINTTSNRQPVYGEQIHRKVGYVENDKGKIYFQNVEGKRIGRVIRYKEHQAPQASGTLGTSGIIPYGMGE